MELAIDTVGERSSVALSDHGELLTEFTWVSGRRHTPSLTPMIDLVCRQTDDIAAVKSELEVVFVNLGPGAYGGIRAGMAAAEGLAVALGLPCIGVGRLEIEAYQHAGSGLAAAVHRAARGTWAWQVFSGPINDWRPIDGPQAGSAFELAQSLADAARKSGRAGVICGEPQRIDEDTWASLKPARWSASPPALNVRRAGLLAELGWRRFSEGGAQPPAALEPLYLREPAIGPQPPR